MLIDFRERGKEGEKGREKKYQCERETSISGLLNAPQPGTDPATQACAQTGTWTHNLSGYG